MSKIVFVEGMRFDLPSEKTPDWIKGKISIKVSDFISFAEKNQTQTGWLNCDVRIGKSGKSYIALNTWKPTKKVEKVVNEDEINSDEIF